MAQTTQFEAEITQAWQHHRAGENKEALGIFERIVSTDPFHLDGVFGLALVQRSLGMSEKAIKTLERARDLNQQQLEENPGADRYEMTLRMIDQRIAEIQNDTLVKP